MILRSSQVTNSIFSPISYKEQNMIQLNVIHVNFTNKRLINAPTLSVSGTVIPYGSNVKYLGMNLDYVGRNMARKKKHGTKHLLASGKKFSIGDT